VIAPAVVSLLAATGALAYFTSTGNGNGSGSTSSAQPVTLSAGVPSTQLYPGGTADVAVTISNPNSFRVHIGSLALATGQGSAGFAVDSGHSGCSTSALSFTSQSNGGTGWFVSPKVGSVNGSLTVDLSNALTMTAGAANACQGATFTVYLTANP
jgi:hypothetical protein